MLGIVFVLANNHLYIKYQEDAKYMVGGYI